VNVFGLTLKPIFVKWFSPNCERGPVDVFGFNPKTDICDEQSSSLGKSLKTELRTVFETVDIFRDMPLNTNICNGPSEMTENCKPFGTEKDPIQKRCKKIDL
jgi:hypothetical protein